MQGKITLEDHFAIPETLEGSPYFGKHFWGVLKSRLLDFDDQRLRLMDEAGVEIMVLSLNAPGIQAMYNTERAVEVERYANDLLAEQVRKRPDRYAGLAALPMQDAEQAAIELRRCVSDLGFKGALVHGFSQTGKPDRVAYYDLPQYRPFWSVVEALDVPFYLHPRNPLPIRSPIYEGHTWLVGPTWAFGAETAVHALRLIGSGLFDECPRLNIVIGHLGEGLPFYLWRIDNHSKWHDEPHNYAARKPVTDYFRANFHVTTSGHLSTPALVHTIAEIGPDRIMFSADYPFEDLPDAARWFDSATIDEADRIKIGQTNARRLFKLKS